MRQKIWMLFVFFAFVAVYSPASAQVVPGIIIRPLLQTTTTLTGQPLQFPLFRNQVTAILGDLAPGGEEGRHEYSVPVIVYILDGALTVEIEGEAPRLFTTGQAYAAPTSSRQNSFNRGGVPVKFLTVLFGEEGKAPLTRLSDSRPLRFRSQTVLQTVKTFTGEPILFPSFSNQLTAVVAEFAPGAVNPRHVHAPTQFAYALEGVSTVEPAGRQPRAFYPGEAWVETIIPHIGANRTTTSGKIFTVFAGEAGVPLSTPRP